MLLAGLDIETTGFLEPDHRIIEVYIGLWQPDGKKVFEYECLIDPQRSIPTEASRVHGYTASDVMGQPTFKDRAPSIHAVLSKASAYIWQNGDVFDGPFLDQEFKAVGLALPNRPTFDLMVHGMGATPNGKKPNLGEICYAFGVDYDTNKAHKATYDVDVMMEAYFNGIRFGYFEIPKAA